jgi:hypothetical protein
MNKIANRGNLPPHLALFAKVLGGNIPDSMSTEFYEMESIREFETKAVDVGYEIVPAMDESTKRGYLVGFEAEEPQKIITLVEYAKLKIYFVECDEPTFNSWIKKIKSHREEQQIDMRNRRAKAQAKRNKRGKKND